MKACRLAGAHGVFEIMLIEITYRTVRLPEGFSHYVKYPKLTESQAKALVGQFIYNDPDYGDLNVYPNFKDNTFEESAIKSFDTLIEANGIRFKDSLVKPEKLNYLGDSTLIDIHHQRQVEEYQRQVDKAWDKNCTHIYIR